jgi:hypothetical protein
MIDYETSSQSTQHCFIIGKYLHKEIVCQEPHESRGSQPVPITIGIRFFERLSLKWLCLLDPKSGLLECLNLKH